MCTVLCRQRKQQGCEKSAKCFITTNANTRDNKDFSLARMLLQITIVLNENKLNLVSVKNSIFIAVLTSNLDKELLYFL